MKTVEKTYVNKVEIDDEKLVALVKEQFKPYCNYCNDLDDEPEFDDFIQWLYDEGIITECINVISGDLDCDTEFDNEMTKCVIAIVEPIFEECMANRN